MEYASNYYDLEDSVAKFDNFENEINSNIGPITTDEDVERVLHGDVYDTSLLGVECTSSEKAASIATGIVCGTTVGLVVAKTMASTHSNILCGLKLIGKCLSTFA